jgi:glycosyltransferase involved in cell wall biosynthesis
VRITSWALRNRRRLIAVHANGLSELNLVAPAVWLTRATLVVWMHESSVSPWGARLAPRLGRRLPIRWAAVSDEARAVLARAGVAPGQAIEVIPNPIDPVEVVASRRATPAKATVAYLGSPARVKGFQLLPELIRATVAEDVEWVLFAGPRSMSPDVWAELDGLPVTVPGKLLDVRQAYARCGVVVCPSLAESFGRVAAEAMANGIPVVASDLPALREVVGDAGLLVPAGDVEAMADAVKRLVGDPELRARLGAEGQRRVAAFAPEPIVARLAALYQG